MSSRSASKVLGLMRPEILAMLGYEPIEPADQLAERLGIEPERILKLDGNENPYGPSPKVLEALGAFDGYHRYPDPQQRRLRAALAQYAGVGSENVVAGAGSDELIDLLLRAVIAPGDAAVDFPPTFGMYRFLAKVAGGRLIEVPRRDDFSVDLDRLARDAGGAKIAFVASPNNPTGEPLSRAELERLLEAGLLVVVDEAYGEFAGESFAPLVQEHENLVVLRTFSKWAGLAGLRAGYGIMAPSVAQVLMQIKQPYTPNVAAEVAMLESLRDRDRLLQNVQLIVEERARMSRTLGSLEFVQVYPSSANFLLCRIDEFDAQEVRDRLAHQGIFVRHFGTPRLNDFLRISVGLPEHTERLAEALRRLGDEVGR